MSKQRTIAPISVVAEIHHVLQNNPEAEVAILRLSALGDVVLWIAVVQAIQKAYPQVKITWITSSAMRSIVEAIPGITCVVLDKGRSVRHYLQYYKQFKGHRFDILLAAQASLRVNLIYPLIRARYKIGFSGRRARDGHALVVPHAIADAPEHLLDSFMRFAYALGVPTHIKPAWKLPISEADKQWADEHVYSTQNTIDEAITRHRKAEDLATIEPSQRPWIAINPATSKAERNWPAERYGVLLQQLVARYAARIILTGGPAKAEVALAESIAQQASVPCINLTGKTSMLQLAAVLGAADVVVAPDTGPLHLANAMQTPTVGLHAVIGAKQTGAYNYQCLAVDYYAKAVRQFLQKDLQDIAWDVRVHDARAMALIPVSAVLKKLDLALKEKLKS